MLTNLDWLNVGQTFPPPCEAARLEMYSKNRQLFEAEHAEVYKEDLKRVERVIGNFGEVISYPVIVNYQKLLSLKVADLLMGEPFQVSAGGGEDESPEQATVDEIMRTSDLVNTAYMVAIDVSRCGDGLLYVHRDGDHGVVDITQPPLWFPVVDESNIRNYLYHVLAWQTSAIEAGRVRHYLTAQIHSKGSVETRRYDIEALSTGGGGTLTRLVDANVVPTGLSSFAVIPVPNIITSDRATGIDDYTDIDSLVAELMVRVSQVSRILDKHATPSMSGPQSALERDPATGEWHLKTGNFFPRDTAADPEPKYITWDGQLEANFKQIERLINFLYTVSEMGAALFGDLSTTTGQVASGSALRRLMVSPLAKVARVRARFDLALKEAIALCSELGGPNIVPLSARDISIVWQDGLPADPVEDAEIMTKRTAQKATMSIKRALMQYDGMTEADAEEEVDQIASDEAASSPLSGAANPFPANEPDVTGRDDNNPDRMAFGGAVDAEE